MENLTQYIIKVGSKYYHWNRRLERMTLVNDIEYAHIYNSYDEARLDIETMIEDNRYKGKKKRIFEAMVKYEEVEF